MNRRNTSTTSSPNEVAKGMGELMCDIVALVELQIELFRIDCRDGLRRILLVAALLLFAGMVAVGTVPIALMLSYGIARASRGPVAGGGVFYRCHQRLHRGDRRLELRDGVTCDESQKCSNVLAKN